MKTIVEKWWLNDCKTFTIMNYKKSWEEVGNLPRYEFRTNGAKRKNGDTCLDVTLTLGYIVINYINWDLQKRRGK